VFYAFVSYGSIYFLITSLIFIFNSKNERYFCDVCKLMNHMHQITSENIKMVFVIVVICFRPGKFHVYSLSIKISIIFLTQENLEFVCPDECCTPSRIPMRRVTAPSSGYGRSTLSSTARKLTVPINGTAPSSRPRTPTGLSTPTGRYVSP
jgi:hypothetical protein